MAMVTSRQTQDPDTLKLTRPEMRWSNDAKLALHEAFSMIVTGRKEVRPREDVASIDHNWERDVFTELDHLRWLEDYYQNLSPDVRKMLEATPKE